MLVSDFHFDLPEELIAQHPPAERGSSRMLVLSREQGAGNREQARGAARLADAMFRDLPGYLRAGDLLVLNDSRVLPARLFAVRAGLGTQAGSPRPSGVVEVLLVEEMGSGREQGTGDREQGLVWRVLVRPAKKVRVGETLLFGGAVDRSEGELVAKGPGLKPHVSESGNRGLKPAANPKDNCAAAPSLTAEVVEAGEFGERTLRFAPVEDFYGVVERIGHMPLPPYIRREQAGAKALNSAGNSSRVRPKAEALGCQTATAPGGEVDPADAPGGVVGDYEAEDRERYQTVYSEALGSAAAPTAGLHFTPEVLAALKARGVEIATVTLHVGLGTFQPVRVAEVNDIRLHAERYTLPAATADALNRAMAEGRRVVAVGTTTTRTLEHIAAMAVWRAQEGCPQGLKPDDEGCVDGTGEPVPLSKTGSASGETAFFEAHSGVTSIFIGPGHTFRVVGGLLTNFHLPESTLLMLVAAFAGERERVLAAYAHAVRERYRFYSYGDCMLVV